MMGHRHNVVRLPPMTGAERLAQLARRPLQPHRDEPPEPAARLRAIDALARDRVVDHRPGQLEIGEVAA